MTAEKITGVLVENHIYPSAFLKRDVKIDFYLPMNVTEPAQMSLLLINDGQDLVTMQFEQILEKLYEQAAISPLLCVGIHCSEDRKNEYGTAKILDYKGRGAKASLYTQFIFEELMPFISKTYLVDSFKERSFAGFSLGGLSALDIVWNYPLQFTKAGVFSGSFWWRDKDQEDPNFDEGIHRIMHRQVREGSYHESLKFF
ncbi:MAG: alpha/beta hydrolase-fold protein, partial [Bacteroidota bacterium]